MTFLLYAINSQTTYYPVKNNNYQFTKPNAKFAYIALPDSAYCK